MPATLPGRAMVATPRMRGRRLQERRRVYLAAHPFCRRCIEQHGRVSLAVELDHIQPLEHGGRDTPDNIQGLCRECHLDKTARDRGYRRKGADVSGWPTDPDHPWNRKPPPQLPPTEPLAAAAPVEP
jgi:hypothetical protein